MKKSKVLVALLLAFTLIFTMALAGCGGADDKKEEAPAEEAAEEPAEEAEEPAEEPAEEAEEPAEEPAEEKPAEEREAAADGSMPMVVGYSNFSSKFSPFFAETAYDQDVADLTQISLLTTDRVGTVVTKGIEGETIPYNGTDYTYYGPADLTMTENADGSVYYDFKLKEGMTFSDGEPVTADDVIFSMYVLADPTYDGSSTFSGLKIEGMEAYRSGMASLRSIIFDAGEENTDFTLFTEDQQKAFWEKYNAATVGLAQEIVDYCVGAGQAEEGNVSAAAAAWGFEVAEGGTVEDFAAALKEAYGSDIGGMINTENAGSSVDDLFPGLEEFAAGVQTGESAANISGIQKVDDLTVRVVMTEVDAPAIYQLGISICPLHYYGDKALYNYEENKFGFTKGDLSGVRAKTTQPMGAGPYKFIKYENGIVNFEAFDGYYKGTPKTKYIQFREMTDADKLNGAVTGTVDITDPSWSKDTAAAVSAQNSNGEITGDKITTSTVDNLGYGYIGLNAINVSVGGVPDSTESKNLRKAIATVFCAFREVAIDSYYGDGADVINYPISNTSWAAPQPTDADYRVAFSVDVNGQDIYTSDMDSDAREAAALEAALGFFEAAGYTVEDGKLTAAPEGASLEYEVMIPADGSGDHPSFMILTLARDALAKIGFNLIINDLSNSSDLWTTLQAVNGEIWCAAWGATIDPDMRQIYFADVANGPGGGNNPNGGPAQGGSSYMYCISDAELDNMIMEARTSTDQEYRKAMYKACLDTIIDWACEVPVYQRQNAIIFSTERVNIDTVTPDITTFYGWLKEIENTEMAQ